MSLLFLLLSGSAPAATSRSTLTRTDPRTTGTLTWFGLDGSKTSTGDNTGTIPASITGMDFTSDPISGSLMGLPGGVTFSQNTGLTAGQLGIAGAAPRTAFFEYFHSAFGGTTNFTSLFGLGAGSNFQDFSIFKNHYQELQVNCWNADLNVIVTPGNGGYIVRAVVTYDGTTLTLYSRIYRVTSSVGDPLGWQTANAPASLTVTLATPNSSSYPLFVNRWDALNVSTGDESKLAYFGIVGGNCWTSTQASDFLQDPTPLWAATASSAPTGTIATATNATGSLSGISAVSASSNALSTGITGTLTGKGAIAGTSAAVSNAAGVGTSTAALSGASTTSSIGTSGTLTGKGALIGTSAASSTGITSNLTGVALAVGNSAATSSVLGTLLGNGTLVGTSAAVSTGTNGVLAGIGNLAGGVSVASAATGIATGQGALVASANAVSSTTGFPTGNQSSPGQTVNSSSSFVAGSFIGVQQSDVAVATLTGLTTINVGSFAANQIATINGITFAASSTLVDGASFGLFLATPNGVVFPASSIFFEGVGVGRIISAPAGASFSAAAILMAGGSVASNVASYPGALLDSDTAFISGGINGAGETLADGDDLPAQASLLSGVVSISANPTSASAVGVLLGSAGSLLFGGVAGTTITAAGGITLSATASLATGNLVGQQQAVSPATALTASAVILAGSADALGANTIIGATLPAAASLSAGTGAVIQAEPISAMAGNVLLAVSIDLLPGLATLTTNAISNAASSATLSASTSYLAGASVSLQNGLPAGQIFVNATLFVAGSVGKIDSYGPREKVKASISLSSAAMAQVQFKAINQNVVQFKTKLQAQSGNSSLIGGTISNNSKISASLASQ